MIAIKKHTILALGYFLLVALLGLLLRFFVIVDVPATYRFLVHTHSHIALLGWVYIALTSIIYLLYLKSAAIDALYRRIFWFTQITILGMLFSFPFQGYALFSIIFSTLFLIATYFFTWMVLKHTPKKFRNRNSYTCVKTSLIYMVFSSIGPWAVGGVMATLGKTSIWYKLAIYFYLHFQYNAWFILALCGFLFFILESRNIEIDKKVFQRFFYLFNISAILTLFLSVLWTQPPTVFYYLAGIGAVVQVFAFLKFFGIIRPNFKALGFDRFTGLLLKIAVIVLILKVLMQLISALPYFAKLAYQSQDFVIGYLHLTFLGLISVSLLALLSHFKLIYLSKGGFWFFFTAFILTEAIIFYRGLAIWQALPIPEQLLNYLFAASCLFPIGIGWLLIANFRKKVSDKPFGT
ncbi:hypothetical protein SAMN05444483_102306 [Salegentibacter echinorum]|uniref:Cytochrome C and Quinol oxidase polypeptide I n=1 Tax=Salegentibacter echinorum TaxID=1073325 RepID=A0A1M5EBH9_SALEC|nr:hypothetical protein [Salegentibacter echinorum]SHF76530.1 hypothetical protein SAMN05444483_102306 [Salegentibacter echinorum]